MSNVLDELRHNIKNSVFINVILIIQFILFFWQSTMILSYFWTCLCMNFHGIYRAIQHITVWHILFRMKRERKRPGLRAATRTISQIRQKYTPNCMRIRTCIL